MMCNFITHQIFCTLSFTRKTSYLRYTYRDRPNSCQQWFFFKLFTRIGQMLFVVYLHVLVYDVYILACWIPESSDGPIPENGLIVECKLNKFVELWEKTSKLAKNWQKKNEKRLRPWSSMPKIIFLDKTF